MRALRLTPANQMRNNSKIKRQAGAVPIKTANRGQAWKKKIKNREEKKGLLRRSSFLWTRELPFRREENQSSTAGHGRRRR